MHVRLVTERGVTIITRYRCVKQRTQKYALLGSQRTSQESSGTADESPPNQPQDRFTGAAVLKRNHVADFMTDVNIHFVCHPEGELDHSLLVDLCAHHAPVLVVDGKAIFSTPLRNL